MFFVNYPGWRSLRELTRGYYLSPLRGFNLVALVTQELEEGMNPAPLFLIKGEVRCAGFGPI